MSAKPEMGQQEKRRAERLAARFRVEIREKLAVWTTTTADLSERGCRILLRRPLAPGMLVELAFDMGAGAEPLVAHAQVAWVRRTEQEAGITFLSVPRSANGPQPGPWIDRLLGAYVRALSDAPGAGQGPAPAAARAAPRSDERVVIALPPVA